MLIPNERDQRRRVSVAEAEADYYAEVRQLFGSAPGRQDRNESHARTLQKPFGFQNEQWEALKAQMQPGDELWEFCSPKASWDALMGVAGYELVRGGAVIATVIIRRN